MTYGQSSGTTTFDPLLSDILLDAFERCGIEPEKLTTRHMVSGRMSCNLVNVKFSNRGVNLWRVDAVPTSFPANQGVGSYPLPADCVDVLDTYIRLYQIGSPVSVPVQFTTMVGSAVVEINDPNHGLSAGQWCAVIIPVSVGGLVILGFYPVQSVIDSNNFTIIAAGLAIASVTGGVVPIFTTAPNSGNVAVSLPNHGLLAGQQFMVQVETAVGGLNLLGAYTAASIIDANNFVLTSPYPAGFAQTVAENNGLCQIAPQSGANPTDLLMLPISRNDYAAIPDKIDQARPTVYWYNRQIAPTMTLWPVPDANGPYEVMTYLLRQIQDAVPQGGLTANLVYRMFYAFTAELAYDLAIKWAPQRAAGLLTEATRAWMEASEEDREKVTAHLMPDFSSYYR